MNQLRMVPPIHIESDCIDIWLHVILCNTRGLSLAFTSLAKLAREAVETQSSLSQLAQSQVTFGRCHSLSVVDRVAIGALLVPVLSGLVVAHAPVA